MVNTSQVNIRCSDEQRTRWSAAARFAKRKLADWARLQIDEGEKRQRQLQLTAPKKK